MTTYFLSKLIQNQLTIRQGGGMIIPAVMEGKILIVDDEQDIRRLTAMLMAPLGRTVVEAANGLTALEIISSDEISLMILDHNMPIMDGMTLLGKVRELGM